MKKILCVITILLTAVLLFACDKTSETKLNTTVPYGDLGDTLYAQLGDLKLSEKDEYNLLRADAYSILTTEIAKLLVNPANQGLTLANSQDKVDELINQACYSTTDLASLNQDTKATYVKKFVDSMLGLGLEATEENIYTESVRNYFLQSLANTTYAKATMKNANSKYYYKNEYQKENGTELLDSDGNKLANPYYVDDKALETYYNSYMKDNKPVEVIILGFATVNDAKVKFAEAGATINEDGSLNLNGENALTVFKVLNRMLYHTASDDYAISHDDLTKYNSSLVSLINEMAANTYTKYVQQINGINYFVYKLADNEEVEFAAADKNQVLEEKLDSLATSSVATTLINELMEANDIKIYDPLFSKLFKAEHASYTELTASEWKAEYSNLVCKVGETNLTVRDFYNTVENGIGALTASTYFADKLILTKYPTLLTEDDKTSVNDSIEATKKSFEEGSLSDYPTTLTAAEFNLLYYQAQSDEEVASRLQAKKVWNHLYNQYPENLFDKTETTTTGEGEEAKTITTVLEDGFIKRYAKQYYENYFSLTINHILVSIDFDMDGSLDDPELLLATFDEATKDAFQNDIVALVNALLSEIDYIVNTEKYAELLNAMKFVVKQYQAGADLLSNPTKNWNEYKTFNFGLKVESLGSVSTSNASSYVKPFSQGVKDLYAKLKAEDKLSSKYIPTEVSLDDLIQTNYGYHVLSSTGTSSLTSAAVSANPEKTYDITWQGVEETLGTNNENLYPSNNQIKIYMAQVASNGSSSLTSSLRTAIEYFYNTFKNRYQNDSFQDIYFAYNNILNAIEFADSNDKANLVTYYEIAKRSYDNYLDYSLTGDQALAGWWTDFNCQ